MATPTDSELESRLLSGEFDNIPSEEDLQSKLLSGAYDNPPEAPFSYGTLAEQSGVATMGAVGDITRDLGTYIESPPVETATKFFLDKLGVSPEAQDVVSEAVLRAVPGADITNIPLRSHRKMVGGSLRAKGRDIANRASEASAAIGGGPVARTAGTVIRTGLSSLPPLILAMTGAGIPGAAVAAGSQQYASSLEQGYQNLRRQGYNEEEAQAGARLPALLSGLLTGVITRTFGGGSELLATKLGTILAGKKFPMTTIKQAALDLAKESLSEVPEEAIDQYFQGILERWTTNPDKSWDEIWQESWQAGLTGGLVAFGIGSVNATTQITSRKNAQPPIIYQDKEEGPTTPAAGSTPPPVPTLQGPMTLKAAKETFARLQTKRQPSNTLEGYLASRYAAGEIKSPSDVKAIADRLVVQQSTVNDKTQPALNAEVPPAPSVVLDTLAYAATRNKPDGTIDEGRAQALGNTYTQKALKSTFRQQFGNLLEAGVFVPAGQTTTKGGRVEYTYKLNPANHQDILSDLKSRGVSVAGRSKPVDRVNLGERRVTPSVPAVKGATPGASSVVPGIYNWVRGIQATPAVTIDIQDKQTGVPAIDADRVLVEANPTAGRAVETQTDALADTWSADRPGEKEGGFAVRFLRGESEVSRQTFPTYEQALAYGRAASKQIAGTGNTTEEGPLTDALKSTVGRATRANVLVAGQNVVRRMQLIRNPTRAQTSRLGQLKTLINEKNADVLARMLGLQIDPKAEGLPAEYAFVTTPRGNDATQSRPEGNRIEHQGVTGIVQEESQDRAHTAQEQSARAEDSQGGSTQQGLRPNEAANYTGGTLTVIPWMPQLGPLEIVESGMAVSQVRQLQTGRVFAVNSKALQPSADFRASLKGGVYIPPNTATRMTKMGRTAFLTRKVVRRIARMSEADAKAALTEAEARRDKLIKNREREVALPTELERIEVLKARLRMIAREGVTRDIESEVEDAVSESRSTQDPPPEATPEPGTQFEMGGINFEIPHDTRDGLLVNTLVGVWSRLNAKYPMLGIRRLRRVHGSANPMYVEAGEDGITTLNYDLDTLVRQVKDMTPNQMVRALEAMSFEDVIVHQAQFRAIHADWVAEGGLEKTGQNFADYMRSRYSALYHEMTAEQQEATRKTYGQVPDWNIAAEFTRQIIQKRVSGETTEEVLSVRFVEFLRSILRFFNNMLTGAGTGRQQQRIMEHILAVEEIMQQAQLSSALQRAGVSERSGRRLATRQVPAITPSDRPVDSDSIQARPIPERLTEQLRSDPGYAYHATTLGRVYHMAENGLLAEPSQVARFTPNASIAYHYAPTDGEPVVVRLRMEDHPVYSEDGVGLEVRHSVPPASLEVLVEGGRWAPITDLVVRRDVVPAQAAPPALESGLAPRAEGAVLRPGAGVDLANVAIETLTGRRSPEAVEGSSDLQEVDPGVTGWFHTLSLDTALRHSGGPNGQVARVRLSLAKARVINAGGQNVRAYREQLENLRQAGYDGAILQNVEDNGVLEPEVQVVFNRQAIEPIRVEPAEPVRMGVRVATGADWDQQFAFAKDLPDAEIKSYLNGTVNQNQVVVGHVRSAWESVSDGARRFLKPIEERFEQLDKALAALEKPAAESDLLSELIINVDPAHQEASVRDVWDNMHTALEDAAKLTESLNSTIEELDKFRADPPTKKVAPIAKKVAHKLNQNLRRQLSAAKKNGDPTSGFVQLMTEVKQLVDGNSTVVNRAIGSLFTNPDITSVDYAGLGIADREASIIQAMLNAAGQDEVDKAIAGAEATLENEVADKSEALAFYNNHVFVSESFLQNQQYLVDNIHVRTLPGRISADKSHLSIIDPITGQDVRLDFSISVQDSDENTRKGLILLNNIDEYLDGEASKTASPISKGGYEVLRAQLSHYFLNSDLNPGAGHLLTYEWSPFLAVMNLPGSVTPEFRLEGQATPGSQRAIVSGQNLGAVTRLVARINREHGPNMENTFRRAADAHGISVDRFNEEIVRPIIASLQYYGNRQFKAVTREIDPQTLRPKPPKPGEMVNGHVITDLDMKAVKLQHDWIKDTYNSLEKQENVWNKLAPSGVYQLDTPYQVFRKSLETGPMTMPKIQHAEGIAVMTKINAIFHDQTNDAAIVSAMRSLLDGNLFGPVLIGHMRSVSNNIKYRRFIGKQFENAYHEIVNEWDEGGMEKVRRWDEAVERVAILHNSSVEPKDQMTNEEVAIAIAKELRHSARKYAEHATQYNIDGAPGQRMTLATSHNFMTHAREEEIAPDWFYQWSVADLSTRHKVTSAVWEVYAQRHWEDLKIVRQELAAGIEAFKSRVKFRVSQGQSEEQAAEDVRKQLQKERLDGKAFYDYDETKFHLKMVDQAISHLVGTKETPFGEEMHTLSRRFRSVVANALMNNPIIASRNYAGGTLRWIQIMDQMRNHHNTLARLPLNLAKVAGTTGLGMLKMGANIVNMMTQYVSWRALGTEWGKQVRHNLDTYSDYYKGMAGMMYETMHRQFRNYEKLREFGITGNSTWASRMESLMLFSNMGGRLRLGEMPPGKRKRVQFALETALGFAYELGAVSLAPADVATKMVDAGVDAQSAVMTRNIVEDMKKQALNAFGARDDVGLVGVTTQLTDQELTGKREATAETAAYIRLLFRKAGINIDAAMRRYYVAVSEAKRNGTDTNSIQFFSDPEFNTFQQVMINEANRGGFFNRPEGTYQTELGRWMLLFYGYPMWANTRFQLAKARHSRSARKHGIGFIRTMNMLLSVVMMGFLIEPWARILAMLLGNEERQSKNPIRAAQAGDWGEFALDAMSQSGAFMPLVGGVANYMIESVKPGAGLNASGVQFVPINLLNDALGVFRESFQTGSPIRPMLKFATRWSPNLRYLTNRLPFNSGLVEYYNVNRTLRANAPRELEAVRYGRNGVYERSAISDNRDNVVNALMRPNGPDWDTIMRERSLGIEQLTKDGNSNPTWSFDLSVLGKNNIQAVFSRKLNTAERYKLQQRMSTEEWENLLKGENLFKAYAESVGRSWDPIANDQTIKVFGPPSGVPRRVPPRRPNLIRPTPLRASRFRQ